MGTQPSRAFLRDIGRMAALLNDPQALGKAFGEEAKELAKETDRLEKTIGGQKKLLQADAILEKARAEAGKLISDGEASIRKLGNESAAALKAREDGLKDREFKVAARQTALADREHDAEETSALLRERETAIKSRESEVWQGAERNQLAEKVHGEFKAMLDARERDLDARAAKFQVAMS